MTLKEYIASILKDYKDAQALKETDTQDNRLGIDAYIANSHKIDKASNEITRTMKAIIDKLSIEDVERIIQLFDKDHSQSIIASMKNTGYSAQFMAYNTYVRNHHVPVDESLSIYISSENKDKCMEYIDKYVPEENKEEARKICSDAFVNGEKLSLSMLVGKDLDKLCTAIETFEKETGREILTDDLMEEIINDVNEHPDFFSSNGKNYVPTLEKEINEAKTQFNDKKTLDALDYINENVAVSDPTDLSLQVEQFSGISSWHHRKFDIEHLPENYKDIISANKTENGTVVIDNSKLTDEHLKELSSMKITFSDQDRALLKEGLELIDSMKDFDGTPCVELERYMTNANYASEQGTKIYSFASLASASRAAKKVVTSKDPAEIERLAAFHKEMSQKMERLCEIGAALNQDNKFFPGNQAVSRTSFFSFKFRNDVYGASMANGFYSLLAIIKENGQTIDEFLDDPLKSYDMLYKDCTSEVNDELKHMNMVDRLETLGNSLKMVSVGTRKRGFAMGAGRSMDFLSCVLAKNNPEDAKKCGMLAAYKDIYSSKYTEKIVMPMGLYNATPENIKQVIFMGDDFDIYKITDRPEKEKMINAETNTFEKKLDIEKAMKSKDFSVSSKMVDLAFTSRAIRESAIPDEKKNVYRQAVTSIIRDMCKYRTADVIKNESAKEILDSAYGSDMDAKKNVESKALETSLNTLVKAPEMKQENKMEALFIAKAASDRYNDRTWIGKIFRPSAYAERRIIASIKEKFELNDEQFEEKMSENKEEFLKTAVDMAKDPAVIEEVEKEPVEINEAMEDEKLDELNTAVIIQYSKDDKYVDDEPEIQ